MSDTPRTDAARKDGITALVSESMDLERELARVVAQRQDIRSELEQAKAAGEALAAALLEAIPYMEFALCDPAETAHAALKQWEALK